MLGHCNEKISIRSEWDADGERFRLVDFGIGPIRLQTINPHTNASEWKMESECYVHSVLCSRIEQLSKKCDEKKKKIELLVDFAIWMTGCGYDFAQHEHFRKKRDELLK
jgi:hypothetical protein